MESRFENFSLKFSEELSGNVPFNQHLVTMTKITMHFNMLAIQFSVQKCYGKMPIKNFKFLE